MKRWLYLEIWWALHNLVAHPLYQLLWWFSLCGLLRPVVRLGDWLHDITIPADSLEDWRG